MTFESRVLKFGQRFLSAHTYRLIIEPAVADLQFERGTGRLRRVASRLGVLRAVAGGVRDDCVRVSPEFLALMLLPTGYYVFLMILWFDLFTASLSTDSVVVAVLIWILSFAPVLACFWPERSTQAVE
jgi:hypothetical protein